MGKEEDNIKESFGLVNHYGPDSLFAVVTHDHIPHSLTLHNNWEDIRAHGYDPILNMEVKLRSDLMVSHDIEEKDRTAKFTQLEATMEVRTKKVGLDLLELVGIFDEEGLNFDKEENPQSREIYKVSFVTNKDALPQVTLDIFGVHSDMYTIQMCVPGVDRAIIDSKEFENVFKRFLDTLERVVRSVYKYEGVDLPPTKLEFKPKETNSPFVVMCSYCKSSYDIQHGLNCPGCNAREPIFGSSRRTNST